MFLPHVGIWVHTSFLCFSTVDGNVGLYWSRLHHYPAVLSINLKCQKEYEIILRITYPNHISVVVQCM
jgi:hypothetical protein